MHPEAPTASPVRQDPRPGLHHTFSVQDRVSDWGSSRPGPRRAETSLDTAASVAESSTAAAKKPAAEPRLISQQLAREFSILKLDYKAVGTNPVDLIHSLEKQSIAKLLDGQIQQTVRHLQALRDRIEDTSSKVLVTGDLNAGKSTFCNALLRRKVLPEDQQPCTSIFCEVLDARENGGLEEVHAIMHGASYDRHDESTYSVFPLKDLESIVIDNERWAMCKIYIKDVRNVNESLLNNGVVDIALIDAPGLNMDSVKTTALFARQEEIDVVVFVVSAPNHFTQTATEFILNAAREKAYMFMVVNGFDMIRDKNRCKTGILRQISHLSPATHKEGEDLVHFVSSNAIPTLPAGSAPGPGSAGGSGSGNADPKDDPDDPDEPEGKHGEPGSPGKGKGKGKEKEKIRDFGVMESRLRQFVLEKRARSKLAPARTYLMNLLGDVNSLATFNRDVAQSELDRVQEELHQIQPRYDESVKARSGVSEEVDLTLETYTKETYDNTRAQLTDTINRVSEHDLGVVYPGPFNALQYADELKDAMISEIAHTVGVCEEYARNKSIKGFNMIKQLGLLHVGGTYETLSFLPEKMFTRRKHNLARQVDIDLELLDFFDFSGLYERHEKLAGTGMAMTVATIVGGFNLGAFGWVDASLGIAKVLGFNNLKRAVPATFIISIAALATYAILAIPQSLPRRLSQKLATQLHAQDYVHDNASRISAEVRRALKSTAHDLKIELQRNVEKLEDQRKKSIKAESEASVARKYFTNLVGRSGEIRRTVEDINLEGAPPGLAAQYA